MRGKDHGLQHIAPDAGITPACAGKSQLVKAFQRRSWDHPRVCGEKVPITCVPKYALGSPPRMRGKAQHPLLDTLDVGITPAYAGKSTDRLPACSSSEDHPRVCGEKYPSEQHGVRTMGSPLRVRGKAGLSHGCLVLVGITPARAGKRVLCLGLPVLRWDHPRVCGEKLSTTSTDIHPAGSPPPVRGKVPSSI